MRPMNWMSLILRFCSQMNFILANVVTFICRVGLVTVILTVKDVATLMCCVVV